MHSDEQRLRFRDAMASLSAAVNVITTAGDAGRCGITATAVCSVTDSPPSVMVCINANSAMNPVFQGNGKLQHTVNPFLGLCFKILIDSGGVKRRKSRCTNCYYKNQAQ